MKKKKKELEVYGSSRLIKHLIGFPYHPIRLGLLSKMFLFIEHYMVIKLNSLRVKRMSPGKRKKFLKRGVTFLNSSQIKEGVLKSAHLMEKQMNEEI